MARQFICVSTSCGRKFPSSERYVASSSGLCPTCLKTEGIPKKCTSCNEKFVWHKYFAQVVGHPDRPQMLCPTCADRMERMAKPDQPVIVQRKEVDGVGPFHLIRVDFDMEWAEICDPQNKAKEGRVPARRLIMRDRSGKSYDGRLDIYDYRPDGQRGFGSLARLRVMQAIHEGERKLTVKSGVPMGPKHEETLVFDDNKDPYIYLVLMPVEEKNKSKKPEDVPAALISAHYSGKSARKGGKSASGRVVEDKSFWSKTLTSSSRTGDHWGGTVVAIVDDEHPVLVRQDNNTYRYGRIGKELEEPGFRENGLARMALFIPEADAELADRLDEEGFKTKLIGEASAVVRLKRQEGVEGFVLPDNLPDSYEIRVESSESGGGATNTGRSQIVCGLDGSALRPYANAGHRGPLAGGTHGWFSVVSGLATIQACRWSKAEPPVTVELATHKVVQSGNTARLFSETLFKGAVADLPAELKNFEEACRAAFEKAQCYHCKEIHFAQ